MMRRLLPLILLMIFTAANAQTSYKKLEIGYTTTVHLVLPSEVINYDIGSGTDSEGYSDILITSEGDRHLKLASAIENFEPTNLFVETKNGYYIYLLEYKEFPNVLFYNVQPSDMIMQKNVAKNINKKKEMQSIAKRSIALATSYDEVDEEVSEIKETDDTETARIAKLEEKLEEERRKLSQEQEAKRLEYEDSKRVGSLTVEERIFNMGENSFICANNILGVLLQLDNIYVLQDKMYFKFKITNRSNVKFEIGYFGFIITDKGKGKSQGILTDKMLTPLSTYTPQTTVGNGESITAVVSFDKFTLDKGQKLSADIWEDKGERKLSIDIKPKNIVRSEIIQ